MIEIIVVDEFEAWYTDLDETDTKAVNRVVDLLAKAGVTLGFPYSSKIETLEVAMRELRIQSGGRPLRVFYAFDPDRQAVLLLGGNKTGDDRFYERMIPIAIRIWKTYLENR